MHYLKHLGQSSLTFRSKVKYFPCLILQSSSRLVWLSVRDDGDPVFVQAASPLFVVRIHACYDVSGSSQFDVESKISSNFHTHVSCAPASAGTQTCVRQWAVNPPPAPIISNLQLLPQLWGEIRFLLFTLLCGRHQHLTVWTSVTSVKHRAFPKWTRECCFIYHLSQVL